MKWLGQYIQSFTARFRDDVYLEALTTTTETDMIVVDSDGLLSKRAIDAITVDVSDFMTNGSDNRVLTATGTDAMNAEGNLQFNGATLTCSGNIIIAPGEEAEATALTITNLEVNEIALNIAASNTTADVVNITADSVTTANVIDISCDALTTGSGLFIDDNSSVSGVAGARSVAKIRQNNTAALSATALEVISNGAATGVLIDKNASGIAGQNAQALKIDFDRTVAGSGTAAHNDIGINCHVNSASLGTSTLKGMAVDVVGATSGSNYAYGLDITCSGADSHYGVFVDSPDSGFTHKNPTASSATQGGKISLISNDNAALGNDHRLGSYQFAAYNGSNTVTGASIQAFADAAWSGTVNDTRLEFYTMDGNDNAELSLTLDSNLLATFAGKIESKNTTTSSATEGGILRLSSDDGAALGDDHRLGALAFQAAEDGSSTMVTGASIQAFADAAWSGSENGTRLEFYTMDGDASKELSLTLDSDLLATFAGGVTVTGALTGTLATATQPNIDSIGTAGDTLSILADDVNLSSATSLKPVLKLLNTTDDALCSQLNFTKLRDDNGVASGTLLGGISFNGEDTNQNPEEYAFIRSEIDVSTATEESGKLILGVANDDGGGGDGLTLTGGSENNEIDVTIGLGTASVTTVAGDLTVTGSDLTFDSVALTAVQTSGESFADDDTSIMTSAAIDDAIIKGGSVTYINILPHEFLADEGGGANKSAQYDDSDAGGGTVDIGVSVGSTSASLFAFVDIPIGKTATHVTVYGSNGGNNITVYESNIKTGTLTSKGTGSTDTGDDSQIIDITDVAGSSTNYLVIKSTIAAVTNTIWGAMVTVSG